MIARNVHLGVRSLRLCVSRRLGSNASPRPRARSFSQAAAPPAEAGSSPTHPLAGVASQIDDVAPRFEINPNQIEILDSPAAFYDTLKQKIRGATRRVFLATLYIGKTEHELIDTIREALTNNPKLQVSILTDALRGTREDPATTCASLLAPLITQFGDRVTVSMYHTPNLNGWKKKYMPRRINEGWGLQHMKLYGFDDEIMLSGANLSSDYFTNRLDRYHVFSSKELTDFYAKIHDAVCEISYDLRPSTQRPAGFELVSPLARGIHDPVWDSRRYRLHAKGNIEPLLQPKARQRMFPTEFDGDKTFVYPIAQMDDLLGSPSPSTFLDYEFASFTSTEKPVLSRVLAEFAEDARLRPASWTFTAGYFNIDPDLCERLLAAAPHALQPGKVAADKVCTVITASPWANGFYGSKGVSGMLPAAYTLLSRRFLAEVKSAGKEDVVQLKEWRKGTVGQPGGMTYHAKGLWITLPPHVGAAGQLVDEPGPSISVVGSSNYTKRSYSLDLEIGALILTGNEELKRRLKAETDWLQRDATVVTKDDLAKVDRRVGFRVRAALWLVEALGGAL
ncbi:hypothetical protein DV737_g288, partial [Chaetothyriales sp. CBS 132003]